MRVREMESREDFLPVFTQTLSRGWSLGGQDVEVRAPARAGEQVWLMQPFLSACYVRDAAHPVRAFLRDSIAFTSVRHRAPLQMALGVGVASPWGLRWTAQPCFSVSPEVRRASHTLVVPGNLRVRIYDFHTGRCLVLGKQGFAKDGMRREIEARLQLGPLSLPVFRHGDDFGWFEEPIFDGYALARCPPWLPRRRLEHRMFELLSEWTDRGARSESASTWAEQKLNKISELALRLPPAASDFAQPLRNFAEALVDHAVELGEVQVAPTHGDMQPGNVLVSRDGSDVVIIDWEYRGERFRHYDAMVFHLGARSQGRLLGRLKRFMKGAVMMPGLHQLSRDRGRRRASIAAFLLEDLLWFTESNFNGPFLTPSVDWCMRLAMRDELLRVLRGNL